MSTITQIDNNHLTTELSGTTSSLIFHPCEYQNYGAARNAIKALMDSAGYENLTQAEKEIVGRWSLITDTDELNNLFDSDEQQQINQLYQSHIKIITSGSITLISSSVYRTIESIIYKGDIANEIVKINLNAQALTSDGNFSARMYDVTNNHLIAEQTGLTNTRPTIIDLGTIQYQPTNNCLLEIQIKKDSGTGRIKFNSVELQFL